MECYKIKNLSFKYPNQHKKCLDNLCLTVKKGEFLTLFGRSGCGKTTLLRHMKPSSTPYGEASGEVFFENENIRTISSKEECAKIGFIQQNPDNMIVCDKVWHELGFGLENLGTPPDELRLRVAEITAFFGLQNLFHKKTSQLSGGQKQLLNLASVLVMNPSVLILDEPTSQLDPISAQAFLETLKKVNRELGVTVIISEHRTENLFAISDRIAFMEKGRIIAVEKPDEISRIFKENDFPETAMLPTSMQVYARIKNELKCPVTISEGAAWLKEITKTKEIKPIKHLTKNNSNKETAVLLKEVFFRYEKDLPDVLNGVSVKIHKAEIFGIVGGNGFGKSTLLSVMSGIEKPQRGKVVIPEECKVGIVPQNPLHLFVKKSVREDLLNTVTDKSSQKLEHVVKLCEIENILEQHPYDLSGGEQQRAAIAKILLTNPDLLLLDEPTKGMDGVFKKNFGELLKELKASGKTIVIVTHDINFCAEYSDRCAMMFDGKIISENITEKFFQNNRFYTTSAHKMAKDIIPDAISAEDIVKALGEDTLQKPCQKKDNPLLNKREENIYVPSKTENVQQKHNFKRHRLAIWIVTLLAVVLTVFTGTVYFENKNYYLISTLIIIEIMLPFFVLFEYKKPKTIEIVTLSVLCTIAIGGRIAFAAFPQVKPMLAIVIIAGACLGGETGFLIGATCGFVSNFYFGQGPWTVWQMLGLGLSGFVSGMLFYCRILPKARLYLSLYGIFSAIAIYGTLVNVSSIFMMHQDFSWSLALTYIAIGFPFDAIHAVSTAIFLWIAAPVMTEKIERIKTKYGLFDYNIR